MEGTHYELPGAFMEGDAEGRFDLEVKGSRGQTGEVERQLSETETETEVWVLEAGKKCRG